MLFQPVLLLPLAFVYVQAAPSDSTLKCIFEITSFQITAISSVVEGLGNAIVMNLQKETSGVLEELSAENIKAALTKLGLPEKYQGENGIDLTVEVWGRCFSEPGWKIASVTTDNSASSFSLDMMHFDQVKHKSLQDKYPDTSADRVLHVDLTYRRSFNPENFFVDINIESADPSEPFHSPIPKLENFTIFPTPEHIKINYGPKQDEAKRNEKLDSEYFCALELHDSSKIMFSSYDKVLAFWAQGDKTQAVTWLPIKRHSKRVFSAKSRRYYVKKDSHAGYVLEALRHDNTTYYFGLVLA